ncbi:unnamed protein product [Adineta steineri]|uniref:EF-hand domain-containing protein n=1 Tax=Adineta steineri TaxID=433720 RepID=A0A815EC92_9BILA|nr:unnamed protein product [Adineta steineri]CAF1498888.1 unnamed protein product [Adineta steineri]CAF1643901.1 unnamed protein product [Adineta steineri]CAF3682287.1 unnamed protein product [Adineta steineri]
MENLIHLPIFKNVIKRYGKYTKKVNGELVKIIYDWFEREDGNQYKLGITKQQYDQMKSIVSPMDGHGELLAFDQFCDILIPVITGGENDHSIWLAFCSFNRNNDQYIQANELELLMHIIGKSVNREQIRYFIDKVDWDHNGQLDYNEFREFIKRGYARELLMMDITREIVYSTDKMDIPIKTN